MSANITIHRLGPTSISWRQTGMNEEKLQRLIADSSKYDQLWLIRQDYDDFNIIPIAQALKYNHSFHMISFSYNKIGDAGVIALAKALLFHPTINSLYLERNLFYPPGVNAMIELKSHVPRLTISLLSPDEVCATEHHRWPAKSHIVQYAPELCQTYFYDRIPVAEPITQVKSLRELCTKAVITSFQEVRKDPMKLAGVLSGIPEEEKENCMDLVADVMMKHGHLLPGSIVPPAIREYPIEIFQKAMEEKIRSSTKRRGMLKSMGFRK